MSLKGAEWAGWDGVGEKTKAALQHKKITRVIVHPENFEEAQKEALALGYEDAVVTARTIEEALKFMRPKRRHLIAHHSGCGCPHGTDPLLRISNPQRF